MFLVFKCSELRSRDGKHGGKMEYLIDNPKLIFAGIGIIAVLMYWFSEWKKLPNGDEQGAREALKNKKLKKYPTQYSSDGPYQQYKIMCFHCSDAAQPCSKCNGTGDFQSIKGRPEVFEVANDLLGDDPDAMDAFLEDNS